MRHRVSKHLQQGIESEHFHVKKNMPKVGGFRSFATAKRTIAGFEAMLWLKKGFGFAGEWTVRRQRSASNFKQLIIPENRSFFHGIFPARYGFATGPFKAQRS